MSTPKQYFFSEISKHDMDNDLWFVYNRKVYDITSFVDEHPGGADTLMSVAGKDGTAEFDSVGHSAEAIELLEKFYVGEVHPDDVGNVPKASQISKSNFSGIAVVLLLIAVCAFLIFKP